MSEKLRNGNKRDKISVGLAVLESFGPFLSPFKNKQNKTKTKQNKNKNKNKNNNQQQQHQTLVKACSQKEAVMYFAFDSEPVNLRQHVTVEVTKNNQT